MDNSVETKTPWRGFHHVALVTPDLDATIRFYRDVLGMEAGEVMERQGRHCFITPGGDTWGLHFFEHADAELFAQPEVLTQRYGFLPGALQHIAFALPDEAAALALRQRLQEKGVEITPINELGPIRNFLFTDNNGLILEAAWPKEAP